MLGWLDEQVPGHVVPYSDLTSCSSDLEKASTDLCEATFSMQFAFKTKYRNLLNTEGDLCCALTSIRICSQDLVVTKQCQVSQSILIKKT